MMLSQDNITPLESNRQIKVQPQRRQANQICLSDLDNKFKREAERLQSFNFGWKGQVIPSKMAEAGFYYTLMQDKVQCAFCHGIVGNWEPNDDPLTEHCRHFPLCPFLLNCNVGNVPINGSVGRQCGGGEDICTRYESPTSRDDASLLNEARLHNEFQDLGIQISKPKNPAQAILAARLRSFKNPDTPWPAENIISSADLANAGFFYIGVDDSTRCFHCSGGLTNWEKGDDPWVEHARWFPKCGYVILNKGEKFIKECRSKKPPAPKELTSASTSKKSSEEQVREVMTTLPLVSEALKLGISKDLIYSTIRKQMLDGNCEFSTVDQLIDAVYKNQTPSADSNNEIESAKPPQIPAEKISEEVRTVQVNGRISPTSSIVSSSSLEEENRALKEQKMCKICLDQEVGVVFLPCGHLICCTRCAPACSECPVCRAPIKGSVRTFLS